MDMITLFAILMMTVAVGATAMACVHYIIARNEIKHMRVQLVAWMNEFSSAADRRQLLNGKMATAMAERVRALETYRVHQTDRINDLEDMVDMLNTEQNEYASGEVERESDWVEGRNERAGLSRGLSRQTDFDDGLMTDEIELFDDAQDVREQHTYNGVSATPTTRRHGGVLDNTIEMQIMDHEDGSEAAWAAGMSRGLSRSTDFDGKVDGHPELGGSPFAYEGTMQDDFELDSITAERRRHVLDETAMHIQIEDMVGVNPYDNTPSMRRYVDTIASQLDDHGNIIRR